MKLRVKKFAVMTSVAVAALVASATSVAWTRTVYRVQGDTASAQLSGGTSCVNLTVNVSASEKVTRDGASRTPTVGVWVTVSGFDACTGYLIDGSMLVPASAFSGTLSSATASAAFVVNLYRMVDSGTGWIRVDYGTASVEMNLIWTGSGTTYISRTFETNSSPTGVVRNRYAGRWQEATVTSSILYNGEAMFITDSAGTTGSFLSGTSEVIRY